jgi:hypothetical protein
MTSVGFLSVSPMRHDLNFWFTMFPGCASTLELTWLLTELHRHFVCPVIIVWDSLPAHLGLENKFQREHSKWFHFERLPTYSPEFNPVEPLWNQIKNVELANFAPTDTKQLTKATFNAVENSKGDKKLYTPSSKMQNSKYKIKGQFHSLRK